MSKEWKAPDKVTQKMTRDGAVAENLTTGETTSISERPQEENYSQAPTAAVEKAVDRIGAEVERQAAKGAGKKALGAAQLKTHTSRLQFSEAERATPELQKSIRKSEKAADRLDAARAAIPKMCIRDSPQASSLSSAGRQRTSPVWFPARFSSPPLRWLRRSFSLCRPLSASLHTAF